MQTATDDRLAGRLLEGRYRLGSQVARGGMSTVYSAVDERLDREVAVKIMSPALSADPAFANRFAQEARIAARLSHPNAVSVFDQGTDAGHVFLVMELVRGQRTLRDLIRQYGALTPALAVSVMQPVLAALAAAHRAGLVHRDVKPENILLSDDGAVKVADFGLARAVESELSTTRTGLMMGTVAYCPPEQLSRGAADARSDVYSAGIVLFELLTGSVPYAGETPMAVAYQHVNSDVPAPSSRRAGIAWQLDELVSRATCRDPLGRQLDAGAFLAELHDVRVDLGLPVVSVPPRGPSRSSSPGSSRPAPSRANQPGEAGAHQTQRLPLAGAGRPPATSGAPFGADPAGPTERVPPGEHHTMIGAPLPPRGGAGRRPPVQARPAAAGKAPRRRRRRIAIIVTLIIVLLGLAAGAGGWWFAAGRYDRVPAVSGLPEGQAVERLRADGFKIDAAGARKQYSETVAAGSVIETSPGASARVLHGKVLSLVVSLGQERFTVPAVGGKSEVGARAVLPGTATGVVIAVKSQYNDTVAVGTAIGTVPTVNTPVKRGDTITLYMSLGPPIISVPNVSQTLASVAEATLRQVGFKYVTNEAYSDTVPVGYVISQAPESAQQAVKFSTITLTISKGAQMVTIPQIAFGSSASDAQDTLKALGLKVKIDKQRNGILGLGAYHDQVTNISPSVGTQVRVNSEVTITAS